MAIDKPRARRNPPADTIPTGDPMMDARTAQLAQFRLMGGYNSRMNRGLYDAAATLTDEERKRDLRAFFRSVHGTLNHLLFTDRIWMGRFARGSARRFRALESAALVHVYQSLATEVHADFPALRAAREETDAALTAWLDELTPEMLNEPMRYTNSAGAAREHALWFAVAHLFNHQTHHRSQATTLLNQLGRDYGVTDFLVMYGDLAASV